MVVEGWARDQGALLDIVVHNSLDYIVSEATGGDCDITKSTLGSQLGASPILPRFW
jgi:hypothetical protein